MMFKNLWRVPLDEVVDNVRIKFPRAANFLAMPEYARNLVLCVCRYRQATPFTEITCDGFIKYHIEQIYTSCGLKKPISLRDSVTINILEIIFLYSFLLSDNIFNKYTLSKNNKIPWWSVIFFHIYGFLTNRNCTLQDMPRFHTLVKTRKWKPAGPEEKFGGPYVTTDTYRDNAASEIFPWDPNLFDVSPEEIPEGMSYEWKVVSVLGALVNPAALARYKKDGWVAVPGSRHPRFGCEEAEMTDVRGMRLMERPKRISQEALQRNFLHAAQQLPKETTKGYRG